MSSVCEAAVTVTCSVTPPTPSVTSTVLIVADSERPRPVACVAKLGSSNCTV